jgi:O-methyltransferase involved in polyketide biosynthesis
VADTAFVVARIRAAEARLPAAERLFDDPYASVFAEAVGDAAEAPERMLGLPFVREGVRLRTRYIDDFIREGVTSGSGSW